MSTLESVAESSVQLENGSNTGSGTVVARTSKSSFVLTCAHILTEEKTTVIYRNGARLVKVEGKVLAVDKEKDIALVRCSRLPVPSMKLASQDASSYDEAFVVGAAHGFFGMAANCVVFGLRDEHIYFSGLLTPGMSGGTLADLNGELIGMPVAQHKNCSQIGFAVQLYELRKFLNKNLRPWRIKL